MSQVRSDSRRSTRVPLKVVLSARGVTERLTCDGETIVVNCHGALISSESGASLGSATGCGVIITVTAVDDSGNATAFTISVPGNGNPYDSPPFAMEGDSSDDTLVGIINNSTGSLSAITLTSANTTFGVSPLKTMAKIIVRLESCSLAIF